LPNNEVKVTAVDRDLFTFKDGAKCLFSRNHQARVVQRLDNTIHWINHYPADSVVCFVNIDPLDSVLFSG